MPAPGDSCIEVVGVLELGLRMEVVLGEDLAIRAQPLDRHGLPGVAIECPSGTTERVSVEGRHDRWHAQGVDITRASSPRWPASW